MCRWLSDAASAESKVAKRCRSSAAVIGQREGPASAAVMTNFLRSGVSEVSQEPSHRERNAATGSMENPQKTGEPVVLTTCCVWSLGPAACLTPWLSGWRPGSQPGLTLFFSESSSGFFLTEAPCWLLKRSCLAAECRAGLFSKAVMSNMEIISTSFALRYYICTHVIRWNVDFQITIDKNISWHVDVVERTD